jgi:3-hydroxyisobutyrate dehydrogenase-like beta-hydroxyacid dehydrogenase
MGGRIARRFIDSDYELVVWNRTAEKTAELVALGATQAATPGDAARQADVVLTMLAAPRRSRRWSRDHRESRPESATRRR